MTSHAQRSPSVQRVLWCLAIAAAIGVGVLVRTVDPLSSPVIPAEDPYTHMAYVREHLRDGDLQSLNVPGVMYPPGMHAYLAAAWVYTGMDLYDMVRFGSILFGAISILGVALLLNRFEDRTAAVIGAFAMALAPEAVFRTTMMAPTAVDLALIPFFLYALLHVLQGRLAWAGVAAPMGLFFAFAHPWLFAILAMAGVAFAALAMVIPWRGSRDAPVTLSGLAMATAIITAGVALSLAGCWGTCGPAFRDVLGAERAQEVAGFSVALVIAAVGLALVALAQPSFLDRDLPRGPRFERTRILLSALLLAALVAVTRPALEAGMPPDVNLPRMLGWGILAAGVVGFVALPFIASPIAHVAAAVSIATYPFVIYNPLDSPFWSHRTVAYLAVGLILLGAVAVARAVRAVARWIVDDARLAQGLRRPAALVLPAALLTLSVGGVWAATPDTADRRWYRLYDACEMAALREVAATIDEEHDALVVADDWRPKLVLAALATDATRIWYKLDLFTSGKTRDPFLAYMQEQERPLIVVTDPYLPERLRTEASFVTQAPWEPIGAWWCDAPRDGPPTIAAYRMGAP